MLKKRLKMDKPLKVMDNRIISVAAFKWYS